MVAFGYNIPDEEYNMVMDECKKHHPRSQEQQEAFLAGYICKRYGHYNSMYNNFMNAKLCPTFDDGMWLAQKCLNELENEVINRLYKMPYDREIMRKIDKDVKLLQLEGQAEHFFFA